MPDTELNARNKIQTYSLISRSLLFGERGRQENENVIELQTHTQVPSKLLTAEAKTIDRRPPEKGNL